ncbi:flagellar hook protein FlgE [Bradyrhizobium sp. STM 3562]|uniref:flagellar hook protein FlgE n=1 Tax=Bradyrhizobium sp. STM 3562 TaxID=578924 RepID=UPI003890DA06
MGIFDALNTSVSGLQAQSFALQNISGNIANASTIGYKGIGTSFEDLIPNATSPSKQVAGGVTAFSQSTITTQGTVSTSTVATNMAINGDGFFNVQKPTSITDNQPVFDGVTYYTRRGDFQINANGNLVNAAGYYLMGYTVDPKTGNPTGNVPQVLHFDNNFIPAQATTAVQYAANLPKVPKTLASTSGLAGTITAAGGINPSDFASNPLPVGSPAPPVDASKTGTALTNQAGNPVTANTALSGTAGSDSLSSGFAAGDSITVNGVTINFVATGATGNQLNITDNVQALLNKISAITGGAASISGGKITLHTGTAQDLNISVPTGATANSTTALGALGFGAPPITQARAPGTNVGTGVVTANDLTAFTNESISGGAVTTYNAAGTPVNLQLRWAMTDSASLGAGHQDTWNLFYQTSTTATGNQTAWVNVGTNFVFNANGALVSPTGSAITIPGVAVDGQALGNLTMNIASGALTQYASSSGAATINQIQQNGFAAGQLQSVAIDNNGIVVGTFSNGQNVDLAAVTLSHFNGTNYLKAMDGGAYAATTESGAAITGASGKISGSSLEGSNTDIADEFTKLIVTQQAYSANTKVITTANSMVQDLLNVLR